MSYQYQNEKPKLFTEDGFALLTVVRDRAQELLKAAGAFRLMELLNGRGITGDSFRMLACVDYLLEKGEIVELPRAGGMVWGQYRVFTTPETHGR